jgi:GMP synthase (glutamine-hydrolysing)
MKAAIINLGSQYTHVIWRTMRDIGVEAVIHEHGASATTLDFFDTYILSGGPGSVHQDKYPAAERLLKKTASGEWGKPILGICLGQQLMAHALGGKVERGKSAEYGLAKIEVDSDGALFGGVPRSFNAWVSHFDEVKKMPPGFMALAHSETCPVESMQHEKLPLYATQFHPEVWHTENGEKILQNFVEACRK